MKRILMFIAAGLLVLTSSMGWSAETVLRTGYQQDSPPRYFVDGGKDKGVCIDLINALNEKLARQNIRIEPTGTYSLARINTMMENSELNLFVGLMKSPAREKNFVFSSVPVYGVRGQFAKLVSDPFEYTGEMSVRGKRVGVLRGAAINGLDLNFAMLAYLRSHLSPDQKANISIFQADMANFRLHQRFSLAIMPCNTLSSLSAQTRQATFCNLHTQLAVRGRFAASLPNPSLEQTSMIVGQPCIGVNDLRDVRQSRQVGKSHQWWTIATDQRLVSPIMIVEIAVVIQLVGSRQTVWGWGQP